MTDDDRNIVDPSGPGTGLGARLGAQNAQEAREFEEIAAQLALATEPVEPPAAMKAALFAKLDSVPQLPAASAVREDALPEAAPSPSPSPAELRARRRWFQRPGAILAAAAAAVVLFIGGALVGSTLAGTSSYQQQQAAALAALNAAPDTQRSSAAIVGGGTATLVWSPQLGRSALVATDLPPLSGGKTYELWYMRDGTAIPAGTMEPTGKVATWRVLSGTMSAGDTVGITVEPSGGSKQPTTKPLVAITS